MNEQFNLSDDQISKLAELGVIDDSMKDLVERYRYSRDQRNAPAPGGTQAGRVFVAANPLEHLASTLSKVKGGRDMGRYDQQIQQGRQTQQDARGQMMMKLAEALRSRQQQQPPAAPSAPTSPGAPLPPGGIYA